MKKSIAILLTLIVLLFASACSGSNGATSSETIAEDVTVDQNVDAPQEQAVSDSTVVDEQKYSELIDGLISDYKSGNITTSDKIQQMPQNFIFPDDLPLITFDVDEMGYYVGQLVSDDGLYSMWISIDDTIYDESKPEDNPKIIGVTFVGVE